MMGSSILIIAFFLGFISHYSIQKNFIRYKKFDDFNHRSSHQTLATRTGGIGIFTTILLICLYFYFTNIDLFDYSLFIPLGLMFIVGVYDDFYRADFKLKFFIQIIVSKILIDQGYVISNYNGFLGLYEVPWLLAQITTIFVFLIIVNAINFIDGIDGLAITQIIKLILIIEFFSQNFTPLMPIGFLLIACIIPLYYFNFKKREKIFLGDGGSLLIGTIASVYLFYLLSNDYEFQGKISLNKTYFAMLCVLYPLADLLRVFVLRIYNKKSPFIPDNNHIHHYLIRKFSHFQALLIITLIEILILLGCIIPNIL